MRRWTLFLAGGVGVFTLLAAWTLRAAWPDRDQDWTGMHFVPIPGDRLWTMDGGPGGRYAVRGIDADCDVDHVGIDEELRCSGYRFFLRREGTSHHLVLAGAALSLPATVGSGREADVVLPFPGMGARQIEVLPVDRCGAGAVPAELPVACVRNWGASGGLIVDRSARQSLDKPLAATRTALRQGEEALVDERDLVWAAHVPLRLRQENGLLLLSVPEDTWTTEAGDRRWMAQELPSWRLGDDDLLAPERHVFWSRETLFQSPAARLDRPTHLLPSRVEFEQEQRLQAFIDHELLCLDVAGRTVAWNLATARGCDGGEVPAPPAALWRDAELAAYQPGIRQVIEAANADLVGLPERTPDPAGMVFVFDWAFEPAADGALRRVPRRLLGVRPGATRNGPPPRDVRIPGDDACALARASVGMPPVDAQRGSTSPWLEVVDGTTLARGSALLLPTVPDGGVASVCVWAGARPPVGATRVEAGVAPRVTPLAEAFSLGQLHARLEPKGGVTTWWGPTGDAEVPERGSGACARIARRGERYVVEALGDANQVRVGETLGEGRDMPLVDGERLRVGPLDRAIDLRFHAPAEPDHLAYEVVSGGHVERHYPFGALASPLVGYGPLAGGVEGAGTRALWEAADARWRTGACGEAATHEGIELTVRGDLQRIVATELAAVASACAAGDPRCTPAGDQVQASAVLMDANSGRVLAVGNWPSFDPNDAVEVESLRRALRLAGPGGHIQVPTLENRAFLRAGQVGSTYKVATAYTLAREGRLTGGVGGAAPAYGCSRFAWYAATGASEGGAPRLAPAFTPDGPRSQPCGQSSVVLSDAAKGFHDAFRRSINLYFGLVPFAVIPISGVDFAAPRHVSSLADPLVNPLGGSPGLWSWDHDGRADLGITLAEDFDPARQIAPDNAFLDVLVAVGHRYHYPTVGGGARYTQHADGVGGTQFPTVAAPWLPGLGVVSGYRYPSIVGPEAYAVEGIPGWSQRSLTLAIVDDGQSAPVALEVGTSSVREYSRVAYGFGGVEASALSLAVMGTPMARPDGSVVAPDLVLAPAQAHPQRIQAAGLMSGAGRSEIERAMRAVVAEEGSTAYGYFPEGLRERIGGKTGTFVVARWTSDVRFTDPATWAAIERINRYGCGVGGVTLADDDWDRLRRAVERRPARHRRRLTERPYVLVGFDAAQQEPPAPGFAASAERCVEMGLRPGRPGVGAQLAGVDGGVWLDAVMQVFPQEHEEEEMIEGSSFVAVVLDGLIDAPSPAERPPGQGWVLAVVVDGHPTAAKRSAARILARLQEHLRIEAAKPRSGAP